MSFRNLFLTAFLGVVLVFAALLSMHERMWWLAPLRWLSHYPLFHIVAHFSIFAGVVVLYGPQKPGVVWLALGGGVLVELVQFVAGGRVWAMSTLLDSLFDVATDLAGAATAWYVLTQRRHRKTAAHV
jgi:hypothetical protein